MFMQVDPEILEVIYTNKERDLKSLSNEQPILLVFLRHFGCTFCRETLADMALMRKKIEKLGISPVMVHMAEDQIAEEYFENYKIPDIEHVSDPDLTLYEYFGLFKGTFSQLYGLKVWIRGFKAVMIDGHKAPYSQKGLGKVNQMPGLFIVYKGSVQAQFIHHSAADRPNYLEIVESYLQEASNKNSNQTEGDLVG
jgi:peroxiredoxin